MISEHSPDGKILMSAKLKHPGANTYRAYKLPWLGRPSQPPDVHSVAVQGRASDKHVATLVHVSWNGATEVAEWQLLRTDHVGDQATVIASSARQGFETTLSYSGLATYVVAVAFNAEGEEIGRSKVVETLRPPEMDQSMAVAEEAMSFQGENSDHQTHLTIVNWLPQASIAFILGVLTCLVISHICRSLVQRAKHSSGRENGVGWLKHSLLPISRPAASSEDDIQQREWMLGETEADKDEHANDT